MCNLFSFRMQLIKIQNLYCYLTFKVFPLCYITVFAIHNTTHFDEKD